MDMKSYKCLPSFPKSYGNPNCEYNNSDVQVVCLKEPNYGVPLYYVLPTLYS